MINPKHLATLVAVAEYGSLAAAGRAIGLSHSAVSLQIKALEEAAGGLLFDRRRKPPTLTARGLVLLERAQRLQRLLAEIEGLSAGEGLMGRFALGVAPSALTHLAPPALAALRDAHPGLTFELETGLSSELVAAVRAGRLQAAVGTLPDERAAPRFGALIEGLSVREVVREPLIAIAPPDAEEREVADLLSRRPFIWFSRRTWAGRAIETLAQERDWSIGGDMEVDSIEGIEELVRHGLGASIIPERAAAPRRVDIRRLPLGAPDAHRALGFYARPESALEPVAEALLSALRRVAKAA